MQTFQTWLWPRHYYLYSRRKRRYNKSAVIVMCLVLAASATGVVGLRQWGRTQAYTFKSVKVSAEATSWPVVSKAPVPKPPTSSTPVNYDAAARAAQAWVASHGAANWAVVIQDLTKPANSVTINAQQSFDAASLYKLFLTIPLAAKLPFASWQTQRTLNGHGEHTYAECVRAMLAVSDNPCGMAVGDFLGWSKATRSVQNAGLSHTSLSYSPIRSTAADVAQYLVGLDQSK